MSVELCGESGGCYVWRQWEEEESYEKGGIIVTSHPSIVNDIWDMSL